MTGIPRGNEAEIYRQMAEAVIAGDAQQCVSLAERAVADKVDPVEAIQKGFSKGMDTVEADDRAHLGRYLLYVTCALIFVYLILPIFGIIPISFSASRLLKFPPEGFSLRWYEPFFRGRNWISATLRSFQVALLTTLLATSLGTLASLALVGGNSRDSTCRTA